MKKQAKQPLKKARDLDGYFKVFLGSTNFHLLMKDIIKQQMTPLDLTLVFSRTENKGDWQTIRVDSKLRNSFLKKITLLRHIRKSLEKLLAENKVTDKPIALFYPNDDGFEYQFAICCLKKSAKKLKLVMYEDGLGSLRDREEHRERRPWKFLKKQAYRLLFSGNYFNANGFRGSLADHYVGLSDESFRQERTEYSRPLTVLDMQGLADAAQSAQSAFLGKKTHIFLSEVLVEARTISPELWFRYIDGCAAAISKMTEELFVKPHPRESGDKFAETVDAFRKHIERVEVLGQRVSIEEYVNGIRDKHNLVLHGCRTGGLYYVKLLYPEIQVVMHQEHLLGANKELDSNIKFHRKLMESVGCKA
ncbi:MAG: hypothetical protein A2052_00455 [Deltaproteobacteria bacterium GWA2_54_12]|nr:MAG: hypothetical protein A2052_00455 [Deltaproteobacteria bacterium GWA2_54_12]